MFNSLEKHLVPQAEIRKGLSGSWRMVVWDLTCGQADLLASESANFARRINSYKLSSGNIKMRVISK